MEPFKPRGSKANGPEAKIQSKILDALKVLDWIVKSTHGNEYQAGFPDIFAAHFMYGTRWIEVKNPEAYCFTPAQLEWFPKWSAAGVGIWILTSAEPEELQKLFKPPNWHFYLDIWRKYT